ncbi:branched-chain amino acid ABC transporter substrate-binding protein [Paraburkholderia sp. JPY432]|uniref:branched-chain amino acid ABC transporter substrate-binding protein n=1 Tax=Paraburkholderia youngii TaxID=2782701 RepID=UPI0015951AC4|nr:branched-chain amino acid ABC transporter substrate-binding protein [Paraburkholderia youngii]NVH77627.1 branched-chain amino acid ABC transporter substrate-binding protein [Paraburkholderia youngii]
MKFQLKPVNAALPLACIAMACGQAALADVTVKIGSAAPLTGNIAHMGQDAADGVKLAVQQINKAGNLVIGGQKVVLEVDSLDDQADPRTGTNVAQKLVDDGVVAVIGHLNSGVSIPASKIYLDNGVTQITPGSTNPQYTLQGYKTAFRVIGTDAQQGPALAKYARNQKVKTVAIVDDATAYGQGLADQFEKTAKAEGIQVLSRDATNDKATDFKAILTKIKAERPDAIMYGGEDATGGPFAKQALQLAVPARILAGDGVCTTDLARLAGNAADNLVCSVAGGDLSAMDGSAAFGKELKAAYGHDPVVYSPVAYSAVYVIVDAMKRSNSVTRAGILSAMPSTNLNTLIGNIRFDEHGDLKDSSISLYKYVKGKRTLLEVEKM